MAKVIRESDGKVLFEGLESDARLHVEQNFPRVHADTPEVRYEGDNGETATFHDGWSDADSEAGSADAERLESDDDDDDNDNDSDTNGAFQ